MEHRSKYIFLSCIHAKLLYHILWTAVPRHKCLLYTSQSQCPPPTANLVIWSEASHLVEPWDKGYGGSLMPASNCAILYNIQVDLWCVSIHMQPCESWSCLHATCVHRCMVIIFLTGHSVYCMHEQWNEYSAHNAVCTVWCIYSDFITVIYINK